MLPNKAKQKELMIQFFNVHLQYYIFEIADKKHDGIINLINTNEMSQYLVDNFMTGKLPPDPKE